MIYTVTLNPAIDYVVSMDALILGEINKTKTENIVLGGKGINVSLLLKALRTESTALGFVAGFTGDAVCTGMEEAGVKADFIRLDTGMTRINMKLHAQEETEINGCGPDIPADKLAAFMAQLDTLTSEDTLVLSGSVPRSLPADIFERIAHKATEKGARLIVDAAGKLLESTLPYKPFLVKPNRIELAALFGEAADTDEEVLALAAKLQKMGAQNVLISMAGDGALLRTEHGEIWKAPAAKGTVVNSVGAGDSMVGGFLAALEKGGSFEEALAMGTASGGATAFSVGIAGFQKIMAIHETVKTEVRRIG